jgi:hypothetical protein
MEWYSQPHLNDSLEWSAQVLQTVRLIEQRRVDEEVLLPDKAGQEFTLKLNPTALSLEVLTLRRIQMVAHEN